MLFTTSRVLLTAGADTGGTQLNAFDHALRKAGIQAFNLIKVTSIVPPGVPVGKLSHGEQPVKGEGVMVPVIYESINSEKVGEQISVAVGCGLPPSGVEGAGVAFVYSCRDTKEEVERVIRAMVKEGMEGMGYTDHRCELTSTTISVAQIPTVAVAAAIFCDKEIEKLFSSQ